jgi:hypothetical protein
MAGKPDFIIAGMPKAGTTTLWRRFRLHEQAFVPRMKEPSFFAYDGASSTHPEAGPFDRGYYDLMITDWDDYRAVYSGPEAEGRICGDTSPLYALAPAAPARIARRLPEAKVVLMVRDPVSRAFSHFAQHVRDGVETTGDFARALEDEPRRIAEGWSPSHAYRSGSRYRDILPRFAAEIAAERLKVVLFDDFAADPHGAFADICRFVGITDPGLPDTVRANQASGSTRKSRSRALRRILDGRGPLLGGAFHVIPQPLRRRLKQGLGALNRSAAVSLEPRLAAELAADFEPDIRCVERFIGRPLPQWRIPAPAAQPAGQPSAALPRLPRLESQAG